MRASCPHILHLFTVRGGQQRIKRAATHSETDFDAKSDCEQGKQYCGVWWCSTTTPVPPKVISMSKISYLVFFFLKFKLHQRFFNGKTTAMHSTPCRRRGNSCQWDEQHLGMFVMQHNHTSTTHGHIDVGDSISDVICLKFKRPQRFFSGGSAAHAQHTTPQEVIANGMSDALVCL